MELIKFNVAEVEAKYRPLIQVDKHVKKPGVYEGKLSNITLEMADGMFERGSNLIALKSVQDPQDNSATGNGKLKRTPTPAAEKQEE